MAFDPYLIWLDISPHERPVNYYRLFSLRPLEADAGVIAAAAQRVIVHVSQFQNSPNAAQCQQLLGELNAARACLLDPLRKAAYDRGFTSPAGAERAINAPPVPGAPQPTFGAAPYVQPAAASGKPAWLANPAATRTQRPGERQISAAPPLPTAPGATLPQSGASPNKPMTAPPSVPAAPQLTTPAKTPAAPLQPSHPSGAIPFGSAPAVMPRTTPTPTTPASTYTPAPFSPQYTPASQQSAVPYSAPAYAPIPSAPSPPASTPPQWAAAERTGRVGTVVAGESAAHLPLAEPPRRVIRRQGNNTMVYVVAALAMAMIVFFFGAVLLLALFMASR